MSNLSISSTEVVSSTNGASVLVCAVAAFLVFYFRLHKVPVYRLALYQVLASLVFATIETCQIIFALYSDNQDVSGQGCAVYGWLTVYVLWMKIILTVWVTIHVFCFAVLHKNLKRFELLYVVTSLLVPVPIASVPLITHSYGVNKLGNCFIYSVNSSVGTIEKFSLWYGPAMVILFVLSVAMVVMVIVLAKRVCKRHKYDLVDDQFWKALRQLLPLSAFPILFFIFVIPVFIAGVILSVDPTPNFIKFSSSATVFVALWSMSSGVTLIVHISVTRCLTVRKRMGSFTIQDADKSSSNMYSFRGILQGESKSGVESITVYHNSYNSISDD